MENRRTKVLAVIAIIVLLVISIILGKKISVSADVSVPEGSPITDSNFYKCVVDGYNKEFNTQYDYNHVFTDEELSKVTKIECVKYGVSEEEKIKNTIGLDKLMNLQFLNLMNNELTELNVSNNTSLTNLTVSNNKLTNIIGLDKLMNLQFLNLINNELTELNVSNNTSLTDLAVSNKLTNIIGLDKLTQLQRLNLMNNQLKELNVSNNTSLTSLTVDNNKLTNIIGLDKLTELNYLSVGGNELTGLDVSKNTKLTLLQISAQYNSVADAFAEELNINLNEPFELIKLPINSSYTFNVDSVDDESIITKNLANILGIKVGTTKIVSSLTRTLVGGKLDKNEIVQAYTVIDKDKPNSSSGNETDKNTTDDKNKPNDPPKVEDDKNTSSDKNNETDKPDNPSENEDNKNISDNNSEKCELSSSVYKIDNNDLIIDNVNKEHSLATIKSNLTSNCGTIDVTNDFVILDAGKDSKTYKVNRIFIPKTGQTVIKYSLVIIILSILIVVGLFVKLKMSKK